MSLEAILTLVTIILAVIALIPQERSQDLRLRLGGAVAWVAMMAAGLMVYWSLIGPIHSLPWIERIPRAVPWLGGWDPASSSLALFLMTCGFCWWTYGRRIPQGRLPKLANTISDALARRRFEECVHLLEAHLASIRDGMEGRFWARRVRRRLLPTDGEFHLEAITRARAETAGVERGTLQAVRGAASQLGEALRSLPRMVIGLRARLWLTAWAEGPYLAAHEIGRFVSLAPDLARRVASSNPYLGLALAELPSTWLVREFAETYARALVADPESVLYRELRRAQNIDENNVPIVQRAEQPLLASLCADAVGADGPRLLYTFLYAGLDALRAPTGKGLMASLNQPLGDYHERARWASPPFGAIYLLEITALRNAVSAEGHPLNLYVLDQLVGVLLQGVEPADEVDLSDEWPTAIHYLLYEVVSLLVDIIEVWRERPEDLPQSRLARRVDGQPAILSAHAIDVLSSVMAKVLRSQKVDARFKGYLLSVWWDAYWKKYSQAWAESGAVLSGLVRGGRKGFERNEHHAGVVEALVHIDDMRQASEGGPALREAFGLPPQ